MKSASIPKPLAFLLCDELHDTSIPHYDGWQKQIVPGWHIRRVGPVYRLMHGRTNIGEIEDVQVLLKNGRIVRTGYVPGTTHTSTWEAVE